MKKIRKILIGMFVFGIAATSAAFAESEPDILFYRDYEDYTTGDVVFNVDESETTPRYGSWNIKGNSNPWRQKATAVATNDGTGVKMSTQSNTVNESAFPDLSSGKLYFSADIYTTNEAQGGLSLPFRINTKGSGTTINGFAWRTGYVWCKNNDTWGSYQETYMLGANKKHKIEVIIDIDNAKVNRYINGVMVHEFTYTKSNLFDMLISIQTNDIYDNIAIIYYPPDVTPQSFSLTDGEADTKLDVLRVRLKSDAKDSDAVGGEEYRAPYGITLKSTDMSDTSYVLDNDTFKVTDTDGNEVEIKSVTMGDRTGEYEIELNKDIKGSETYNVTARENLTDILGAELSQENAEISITASNEDLSASVVRGGNGYILEFSDDIYNTSAAYTDGAVLKNIYTGEESTGVKLSALTSNTAAIENCEIADGYEYVIVLPASIRGQKGNTINNNVVEFSTGVNNSLGKLTLVDVQGNETSLQTKNVAWLKALKFDLIGINNPDEFLAKNLTITNNEDGSTVDFTTRCDGTAGLAELSSVLHGDTTYTINLNELMVNYAITLNTEEAKLAALPIILLNSDGERIDISEVEAGSTVKIKLDLVNTTKTQSGSFIASAAMFNGAKMSGFDFNPVELKPTTNGGKGYAETIMEFTVQNSNDLKFKGYMWNAEGLIPASSVSVIE